MAKQAMIRWVLVLGIGATLAGCEEGQQPLGFLKKADADTGTEAAAPRAQGRTVERDVEAPEVFRRMERGFGMAGLRLAGSGSRIPMSRIPSASSSATPRTANP